MRGRIGSSGREVHILVEYDETKRIGRVLCGLFEGKIRFTIEEPTCRACIRRFERLQYGLTP